jgi:predicted amidohydrolase
MVDQPGGCRLPESMAVHDHRRKNQINAAMSEEGAAVIAAIKGILDNSRGTEQFCRSLVISTLSRFGCQPWRTYSGIE